MTTPHHHSHIRKLLAAVAVAIPAMLVGVGLSAPSAQAGYTVTLEQVPGTGVVASGSGPIDLTGLHPAGSVSTSAFIHSTIPLIITGPTSTASLSIYEPVFGPGFGPGGPSVAASSGSGDLVGINLHDGDLLVPAGYMSGNPLSDMSTYNSQTFTTLGVTPGTYEYTWGPGANQNFTLQIGPAAAVPEPSSLALLGVALAVLMLVGASGRSPDAG